MYILLSSNVLLYSSGVGVTVTVTPNKNVRVVFLTFFRGAITVGLGLRVQGWGCNIVLQ